MESVRLAIIEDAPGINSVSKYLGYPELSDHECSDKLQQLLSSRVDEVYVALEKGKVVGWLHLFQARRLASANFYEIGGLVVNPENRGKGIGRALVEYATKIHSGKFRVRCNEKRRDSHAFYESVGFNSSKVQHVFEVSS